MSFLLKGLKEKNINTQDIEKSVYRYDPIKLKLELISFLKLIIQICTTEIPFLKQLINRKEEKVQ